ncbi:MAG TPA: KEOPS complex kinase/ATPase Bud32 [Candidatus Norongarragalinales archaeon]|jgi:TP53 regulating kinase-like protein|nr:KEOPS complex kinase/ATPase Bud32 [Candidatus Norongarragalinales archaeon]
MHYFAKGAEAQLSNTELLGANVVCKTRTAKAYRPKALDDKIRAERTKTEARVLTAAKNAGCATPLVLHVDLQNHEIFLSKIEGELARIKLDKTSKNEQSKVLQEAGKQLAALHNAGMYHGDSTTSNFMIDSKNRVWWIDFGLADYSTNVEEYGLDILLMKKSLSPAQFLEFWKGYSKQKTRADIVKKQLAEIELRGRYVERGFLEGSKGK